MWLVHFKHREARGRPAADRAKFLAFRARYEAFLKEDCTELCSDHHVEVHQKVYLPIIKELVWLYDKPCHKWTWREAETLMRRLRKACDKWLWDKIQT